MHITGDCHCGNISYEAEVDPGKVNICHCTDCQILTGGAYRVTVPSLKGTFKLLGGKPWIYVKTAESGAKRLHAFCPDCGTPLYATADEPDPQVYGIRVGTVKQKTALRPATQGWCRSALDWSMNIEALPRSAMQR
jgi:hypothetical protein